MQRKKVRKIKHLLLKIMSVFFISLAIFLLAFKYLNHYNQNKIESKNVELFFEESSSPVQEEKNESHTNESNYIAILEIPKINLKKGLLDIEDKDNTVEKNIEILPLSNMPNEENSNLILASHSGSSTVSFFKDLYLLNYEDSILIYYRGIKYEYKIVNMYDVPKTGFVEIKKNTTNKTITLITCRDNDYQIIIIAELNEISEY